MRTITINEAKLSITRILGEIESDHETYVVYKDGKPIADIIPHKEKSRLDTHPIMGEIKIKYDPTEEMTEDEWGGNS